MFFPNYSPRSEWRPPVQGSPTGTEDFIEKSGSRQGINKAVVAVVFCRVNEAGNVWPGNSEVATLYKNFEGSYP
jgi:hypothetical protein